MEDGTNMFLFDPAGHPPTPTKKLQKQNLTKYVIILIFSRVNKNYSLDKLMEKNKINYINYMCKMNWINILNIR